MPLRLWSCRLENQKDELKDPKMSHKAEGVVILCVHDKQHFTRSLSIVKIRSFPFSEFECLNRYISYMYLYQTPSILVLLLAFWCNSCANNICLSVYAPPSLPGQVMYLPHVRRPPKQTPLLPLLRLLRLLCQKTHPRTCQEQKA